MIKFIAEVSSNHHQDIKRSFKFIDAAASAGCKAVKFQLFKIEKLFAPEILKKSAKHRERRKWELPIEFIPKLSENVFLAGFAKGLADSANAQRRLFSTLALSRIE